MENQLPQQEITFNKSAFSLVETLIAVTILILVLLASVTLGSVALRNMVTKAQTAQATSLAQNQLETVRNIRDNLFLVPLSGTGQGWDTWVGPKGSGTTAIITGTNYHLSPDATYLISGPNTETLQFGDNAGLKYIANLTFKAIQDTDISQFDVSNSSTPIRLNKVESGANAHSIKIYEVDSKVTWDFYGSREVVLKTYLSDWMPRF